MQKLRPRQPDRRGAGWDRQVRVLHLHHECPTQPYSRRSHLAGQLSDRTADHAPGRLLLARTVSARVPGSSVLRVLRLAILRSRDREGLAIPGIAPQVVEVVVATQS